MPGRSPRAADLAGLTDRPVFVTTYDQHSVWLNDVAVRALGIRRADSIAWGNPEIDAGLLTERADLTIVAGAIVHDAADTAPLPEAPPAGTHHCSAVA